MKKNKSVIIGSFKTALVVGTILTLTNQYAQIFSMDFDLFDLGKWSFNYLVPFLVSFYSRMVTTRQHANPHANSPD